MTPLRERGPQAVADAWNASVSPKYRIGSALVAQNLLDHPLLHEGASLWNGDAFVAVKRSGAGLYHGPDAKVAHLSLFASPDPALLTESVSRLREEGMDAIVVGQDSGHFLPGAPTDVPWMGPFLRHNGFKQGALAFDLERTLGALAADTLPASFEAKAMTEDGLEALDRFLAREFSGRWRYDVMGKVAHEGPSTVFGLFRDARCEGFALLQGDGCRHPIGGAVWKEDLGTGWGSLGPIGISEGLRGDGLGRTFLSLALVELQSRGARRVIIDWTGLVDFYGTQGFSVNRAYRAYRLSLREDRPPAA